MGEQEGRARFEGGRGSVLDGSLAASGRYRGGSASKERRPGCSRGKGKAVGLGEEGDSHKQGTLEDVKAASDGGRSGGGCQSCGLVHWHS